MLKKIMVSIAACATAIFMGTAAQSAVLEISGGETAFLGGMFDLTASTGLTAGTEIKTFTSANDGPSTGLMLLGAPTNVTFTYLGSEAGNTNRAFETEDGHNFLFSSDSAAVGASESVNVLNDGAVPFKFTSTSCWWIFCDTDGASNDGNIDKDLTMAFFQESPNSVIALFGDGGGDSDFDDMAIRISVVPLPPAFAVFGGAMLGLGWLARRRKQQG